MYSILYTKKGCERLKVEAKDIPIMHKFMPEFWKTIKEFYNVENTSKIPHIKIKKEEAVSAGVRRIKAVFVD